MIDWVFRPDARAWRSGPHDDAAWRFHRGLPGYAPSPLVDAPALADALRVGRVLVKDESDRFGLPAFKILGVSWAVERLLATRAGVRVLVAATDGNHGRAVARTAPLLGLASIVFVPHGVHPGAVAAIVAEGADVRLVDGSYDDAVAAAAVAATEPGHALVQDTDVPGHHDVPRWIVDGYATLFHEIDAQVGALVGGSARPDLVVAPVGVGSLAQAAVSHYRGGAAPGDTALLAVEPVVAAGVLASLAADSLTSVDTSDTVMAGLNCGTPSALAWPVLRAGLDAAVTVTDAAALGAIAALRAAGVRAGPCGAATLAGARAALAADERRRQLRVDSGATIVLLSTESADANPHGG